MLKKYMKYDKLFLFFICLLFNSFSSAQQTCTAGVVRSGASLLVVTKKKTTVKTTLTAIKTEWASDLKISKTPPWLNVKLTREKSMEWTLEATFDSSKAGDNPLGYVVLISNPGKRAYIVPSEADSGLSIEHEIPVGYWNVLPVFRSYKFLARFDISKIKNPIEYAMFYIFGEFTVPIKIREGGLTPWEELTVVAANAPKIGKEIGVLPKIADKRSDGRKYLGLWNRAEVTDSVVQFQGKGDSVVFYLENMGDTDQIVGAREHAAGGPLLFIVVDDPSSPGIESYIPFVINKK